MTGEREIRACGLREGEQFAFVQGGALEPAAVVRRICTGFFAGTEVWPDHADPDCSPGWWFWPAETVWVDR